MTHQGTVRPLRCGRALTDRRDGFRLVHTAPDALLAAELSERTGDDGLILAASGEARAARVAAAARVLDSALSV